MKRKKCILCNSNRLVKKILTFGNTDVCNICVRGNKELRSYINEFDKIKNNTFDKANMMVSEKVVETKIQNEVVKYQKKKNLKKEIITKVNEFNNSKDINKKVNKVLDYFEEESLEDAADSLRNVKTAKEYKEQTELKIIKKTLEIPDPKDLYNEIISEIIDQNEAVKVIAMAITKHYCRLKNPTVKKNNIMILGPTGTGKTELVKTLSKKINLPVVMVDASSFTANGYKGSSAVETIISSILTAVGGDIEAAKKCIVFIDEIDKKATINSSGEHSVTTASVQQELLTMLQGDVVRAEIPVGRNYKQIELDTSNILFITAGAFAGLDNIINDKNKKSVGINVNKEESNNLSENFKNVSTKNLVSYGLIPEFLGRFSTITYTNKLSEKSLIKILTDKSNSLLKQYNQIFGSFNCTVEYSKSFLKEVANEAIKEEIGARGLERILEKKMEAILFNIYDYVGNKIILHENGKYEVVKK